MERTRTLGRARLDQKKMMVTYTLRRSALAALAVLLTPLSAVAQDDTDREAVAVPVPQLSAPTLTYGYADSVMEEPYRLGIERRTVTIQEGDNIAGLISDIGIPYAEAHEAGTLLFSNMNPGDFRPGRDVTLLLQHRGPVTVFAGIEFTPTPDAILRVDRNEDGAFTFESVPTTLTFEATAAAARIDSSLYLAANGQGVPDRVLVDLIKTYSHSVDFQREIREGDAFELLYERAYFGNGEFARSGDVLFASLTLSGSRMPIYRFERDDGTIDYFDGDGESARRQLLATPLDGFRISSRFGPRRHPILGYTRMHRGIDFAAPTGTPIYAAGNGVVEFLGSRSGYGNYIRIRHNGTYKTAYAHLSRYASGLSNGSRVQQGEVIGYVGSTGMSTGPHLHYEVIVNGEQVNPLDVDLPTAENLEASELARFEQERDRIDAMFQDQMTAAATSANQEEVQVTLTLR